MAPAAGTEPARAAPGGRFFTIYPKKDHVMLNTIFQIIRALLATAILIGLVSCLITLAFDGDAGPEGPPVAETESDTTSQDEQPTDGEDSADGSDGEREPAPEAADGAEPVADPAALPDPEDEPEAYLQARLADQLGDVTRNVERVSECRIGYNDIAWITFAAEDAVLGSIRRGILEDVAAILEAVHDVPDVRLAHIRATFSLEDEFGGTDEGQVLFSSFEREAIDRLGSNVRPEDVPRAARNIKFHPELAE
jgi:hypothetical protein